MAWLLFTLSIYHPEYSSFREGTMGYVEGWISSTQHTYDVLEVDLFCSEFSLQEQIKTDYPEKNSLMNLYPCHLTLIVCKKLLSE